MSLDGYDIHGEAERVAAAASPEESQQIRYRKGLKPARRHPFGNTAVARIIGEQLAKLQLRRGKEPGRRVKLPPNT